MRSISRIDFYSFVQTNLFTPNFPVSSFFRKFKIPVLSMILLTFAVSETFANYDYWEGKSYGQPIAIGQSPKAAMDSWCYKVESSLSNGSCILNADSDLPWGRCYIVNNRFPAAPQEGCPDGWVYWGVNLSHNTCTAGKIFNAVTEKCELPNPPNPNLGKSASCDLFTYHPINIATGNKFRKEIDFESQGANGLVFVRYYNSQDSGELPGDIGAKWRHNYLRKIIPIVDENHNGVYVYRADGDGHYWELNNSVYSSETDTGAELETTPTGWVYRSRSDVVETYDSQGLITEIRYTNGYTQTISYGSFSLIESVTDTFGQTLTFEHDAANLQIKTLIGPSGQVYKYMYDSAGNLESVTYPDNTPLDETDDPIKIYHYDDPLFSNSLTGITDENGNRYATFEYDSQGLATVSYLGPPTTIPTERIDGVTIMRYADGSRTVTDSKGNSTIYQTTTQLGITIATQIDGPSGTSCGASNISYTYDTNNNVLSRVSNGTITRYGNYDEKGNYHCKIEGINAADTTPLTADDCSYDTAASPNARKIEYTYDSVFRNKIATITRPSVFNNGQNVTTYGYDDYGNRTLVRVDGFKPDGTAVSRSTSYQYGGDGTPECDAVPLRQLCRVDGPRTDVADITTYRYYPDDPAEGNNRARLKEIEDAYGNLVRSNIQYTATGKVDSEQRLNGLVLDYAYTAGRDRLETLTESAYGESRTTKWTYRNTGEIETITLGYGTPDATTTTYEYDDARRLVKIADGLGNYIKFILDTEGNKEGC